MSYVLNAYLLTYLQLEGNLYHAPSYIRDGAAMWAYGRGQTHTHTHTDRQTDTQTRVTTIYFASSTTHAKCNDGQSECPTLTPDRHLSPYFRAELKIKNRREACEQVIL